MKTMENWRNSVEILIKTTGKIDEHYGKQTMKNYGTNDENHGTIDDHHGTIDEHHGKDDEHHGTKQWKLWNNRKNT